MLAPLIAFCVTFVAAAPTLNRAILVGPDLEAKQVLVVSLRDGELSVFDDERILRTLLPGDYLQLRFVDEQPTVPAQAANPVASPESNRLVPQVMDARDVQHAAEAAAEQAAHAIAEAAAAPAVAPQPAPSATLELVDGRRLSGKLVGFDDDGQQLRWSHPALIHEALVDLDQIAVLTFAAAPSPAQPPAPGQDRVVLTNGDALEGFVLALTEQGVAFKVAGSDDATVLPLDRLAVLQFANPRRPRSSDEHVITLADGSRLYTRDLAIESQALAMIGALPGRPKLAQNVPLSQVRRIDFASPSAQLLELAEQPWQLQTGGEVFGRPVLPRLRDEALYLHAPVKIAFTLPAGARRLAASAQLELPAEPGEPGVPGGPGGPGGPRAGVTTSAAAWADLELIVRLDGVELARQHLDWHHRAIQLNLPVQAGELTIELDPAANGPIMDRLRLADALVLIQP